MTAPNENPIPDNPTFVWWLDDGGKPPISNEQLRKVVHLMSVYFRQNERAMERLKEAIEEIIGPPQL